MILQRAGRGRDRVSGDRRKWYQKEVPVEVLLWASTAVQPPAAHRWEGVISGQAWARSQKRRLCPACWGGVCLHRFTGRQALTAALSHCLLVPRVVEYVAWLQSCPTLCDPMDCSPPGSSVHGILQQEYWSGVPFPSPGGLPDPGIKPTSLMSPTSAGGVFTTGTTWEAPVSPAGGHQ